MNERPLPGDSLEVVCPHCKRTFRAEPIGGASSPRRGFKCPHCKLFTPVERVGEQAARNRD